MKHLVRVIIFLIICLLFSACEQSITATLPPITSPTAIATSTFTPIPSPTLTATVEPTSGPEFVPPTLIPTIDPTLLTGLLNTAFVIQTVDGIDGYNLSKIGGWEHGFYPSSFCHRPDWLDRNHLLLFPRTGQIDNFGTYTFTTPIVINHQTGEIWFPSVPRDLSKRTCPTYHFVWSEKLGIMVMAENDKVGAYAPNGDFLKSFGKFPEQLGLILSPSETKIVFGTVWIDLQTGQVVKIRSQEQIGFSAWSSDETQLFGCCYYYGNANTGKGYKFEFQDGLRLTGRGGPLPAIDITWVGDDTFALINYDFRARGFVDIPFIDPVARTYKDIHELTDIPSENYCGGRFLISPDKQHLWTNCEGQGYLTTLASFETEPYGDLWLTSWSKDSQFALVGKYNSEEQQILSVSRKNLIPLSPQPILITLAWHPIEGVLAYLAKGGTALITIDVESGSSQETKLPSTFRDLDWSPMGEYISLLALDNSLWKINYPKVENLEQLTPSLHSYTDFVSWSPDSAYLSFVSGSDIYIVDTMK
jgi:hypothetical protein